MRQFVSRAQSTHAEVLAASGSCSAYAGVGDPYLPFHDVMEMLAGAVEAKWAAGVITGRMHGEYGRSCPETAEILIEAGPDLIDIFVPEKPWLDERRRLRLANPHG